MLTSRALLAPSVPTLLIEQQRGHVTEMITALQAAGEALLAEDPQAIVCVSARWKSEGPFLADDSRRIRTLIDLPGWGVEPRYDCAGDPALARAIVERAQRAGLRAGTASRGADTGVAIPLHFLSNARRFPVVPLSLRDGATRDEHRRWGAAIRATLEAWEFRVAFVVGGTLTFNQHAFNLKREQAESLEVDEFALGALQRGEWNGLATVHGALAERAMPEASWMHLEVLRGFLGKDVPGELLAYENAPGIGSALAGFPLPRTAEH